MENSFETVHVASSEDSEWTVTFDVKGLPLELEIDSGARCNIISKSKAQQYTSISSICGSSTVIHGVCGSPTKVYGEITLPCRYKTVSCNLTFKVMDTPKHISLLGRPDSLYFGLITRMNMVKSVRSSTNELLQEFSGVVGDSVGCLPGEYDIKIDISVEPVVHAPGPVPVAMRDSVKQELDHLVKCNIIPPVTEPTSWVSSMVCVRKKNRRVRICLDPTDLNKAVLCEHFPMNTIEDIATRVHGSKIFSTLDANMGYFQIKLSKKSSLLTTFNTPFGRYLYLHMSMGLKCAAEVFQREMINHFGTLDGVEVVIDDILVHGRDDSEHNSRLRAVLERAKAIDLKLNKSKCVLPKTM
jgi:hypothetical protein